MKRPPLSVLLLGLLALLLPVMGGQLNNDAVTLEPSFGSTISAVLHGVEAAGLQHALLALIAIVALCLLLAKRKITQAPHLWVATPLGLLVVLMGFASLASNYKWQGIVISAEWMSYAIILLAAVAGIGRKFGPTFVLSALVAGCSVASLFGLTEYGEMKQLDPTWRIFGGWYNPNALAGMLIIGFIVGIALLVQSRSPSSKLILSLALLLNGLAILLTGSKGGLLSLIVGVAAFAILACTWSISHWKKIAFSAIGAGALIAVLFVLLKAAPTGGSIARVTSGASSEQSTGFRKNLWLSSIELVKENPLGSGPGSFDQLSAKPGIVTRTVLAHSNFLQILVEAGVQGVVCLFALLLGWAYYIFRGTRRLPPETNIAKAGIVAAVLAILANGFIETNLYYFGIGATFFLLLGIGLQLSADGVAPEFTFKGMRAALVAVALATGLLILYAGNVYKSEANARYLAAAGNVSDARAILDGLQGSAPFDGEVWYRSGLLAQNPAEMTADFQRAANTAPSTKYFRALARVQTSSENFSEAEQSLLKGLKLDPHNLAAMYQLLQLYDRMGRPQDARKAAEDLVQVESTTYFKVRSIPEQVPVETYRARIFLTRFSKDPATTLGLLKPALEGFDAYAKMTVPYARNFGDSGGPISLREAKDVVEVARQTAQQYIDVAKTAGDNAAQAEGQGWLETFDKTLEGFR